MSDFIISLIRTWVPYIVALVIGWLIAQGVLDEESGTQASTAISGGLVVVIGSAYYWLVRLAAKRWPAFEWLLGYKTPPTYQ